MFGLEQSDVVSLTAVIVCVILSLALIREFLLEIWWQVKRALRLTRVAKIWSHQGVWGVLLCMCGKVHGDSLLGISIKTSCEPHGESLWQWMCVCVLSVIVNPLRIFLLGASTRGATLLIAMMTMRRSRRLQHANA